MSLKATARWLEVAVGYLEYRFPVQVKEITARYKYFKQVEHLKSSTWPSGARWSTFCLNPRVVLQSRESRLIGC